MNRKRNWMFTLLLMGLAAIGCGDSNLFSFTASDATTGTVALTLRFDQGTVPRTAIRARTETTTEIKVDFLNPLTGQQVLPQRSFHRPENVQEFTLSLSELPPGTLLLVVRLLDSNENEVGLSLERVDVLAGQSQSLSTLPLDQTLDLTFSQINFDVNGEVVPDSEWGQVVLRAQASTELRYFNLVVNGGWVLVNQPVFPSNITDTLTFPFGLGVTDGSDVTTLNSSATLTTRPLNFPVQAGQAILAQTTTSVGDSSTRFAAGLARQNPGPRLPSPPSPKPAMPPVREIEPLIPDATNEIIEFIESDEITEFTQHDSSLFPNQEVGLSECVPTAVSNSLQFLNTTNQLNMTDTSIDLAKGAVGFDGSLAFDGLPSGSPNDWPTLKNNFMTQNGLPIETVEFIDFEQAFTEISAGNDVEIDISLEGGSNGHVIAVKGVGRRKDGKLVIVVRDDVNQGLEGGTTDLNLIVDPNTREIEFGHPGVSDIDGYGVQRFVVERPIIAPAPSTTPSATPTPTPTSTPPPSLPDVSDQFDSLSVFIRNSNSFFALDAIVSSTASNSDIFGIQLRPEDNPRLDFSLVTGCGSSVNGSSGGFDVISTASDGACTWQSFSSLTSFVNLMFLDVQSGGSPFFGNPQGLSAIIWTTLDQNGTPNGQFSTSVVVLD